MNLELTEAKEEVQKESNQKAIMALEIRMFGEKFGTITDFNSALGMVERSRVRNSPAAFFSNRFSSAAVRNERHDV